MPAEELLPARKQMAHLHILATKQFFTSLFVFTACNSGGRGDYTLVGEIPLLGLNAVVFRSKEN